MCTDVQVCCLVPSEAIRGTGVTGSCELVCRCWELNLYELVCRCWGPLGKKKKNSAFNH